MRTNTCSSAVPSVPFSLKKRDWRFGPQRTWILFYPWKHLMSHLCVISGNLFDRVGIKLNKARRVRSEPVDLKNLGIKDLELGAILDELRRLYIHLRVRRHPKHAAFGWWFPEKPAPAHGCFDRMISLPHPTTVIPTAVRFFGKGRF